LLASARPVSAQSIQQWIDRGYVNFNVAFETAEGSLDDAVTFRLYDENGSKTVNARQDSGPLFDISGGLRVWRNVSVGLGFHRGTTTGQADAVIVAPHPLFFSQDRRATLAVDDLKRIERAIHVQFGYMLPVNEKFDIHVTGGPTFFRLEQEVVSDITFTEVPPAYTTINATAVVTNRARSVTGANIGADATYKLYDTGSTAVGVGGFIRYSGAKADVTIIEHDVETDVGGVQFGFGVRFRF
jgi:hypothetical protein